MDFVMGLTDRLVVMEFGDKLAEGTPAEVQAARRCARRISAQNTSVTLHAITLPRIAARRARAVSQPGVSALYCGGRPCGPTPLRCSV